MINDIIGTLIRVGIFVGFVLIIYNNKNYNKIYY